MENYLPETGYSELITNYFAGQTIVDQNLYLTFSALRPYFAKEIGWRNRAGKNQIIRKHEIISIKDAMRPLDTSTYMPSQMNLLKPIASDLVITTKTYGASIFLNIKQEHVSIENLFGISLKHLSMWENKLNELLIINALKKVSSKFTAGSSGTITSSKLLEIKQKMILAGATCSTFNTVPSSQISTSGALSGFICLVSAESATDLILKSEDPTSGFKLILPSREANLTSYPDNYLGVCSLSGTRFFFASLLVDEPDDRKAYILSNNSLIYVKSNPLEDKIIVKGEHSEVGGAYGLYRSLNKRFSIGYQETRAGFSSLLSFSEV